GDLLRHLDVAEKNRLDRDPAPFQPLSQLAEHGRAHFLTPTRVEIDRVEARGDVANRGSELRLQDVRLDAREPAVPRIDLRPLVRIRVIHQADVEPHEEPFSGGSDRLLFGLERAAVDAMDSEPGSPRVEP